MPRVLRIINRFNLGGPTYNAAYLTAYLQPEFETMLIGGSPLPDEAHSGFILDELGVAYTELPEMSRSVNLVNDLRAFRKIRRIIREFKPDIVHTHAAKAGALGRLAASLEKVPVIVHTFHGHVFSQYFGSFKSTLVKNVERWLAKKSSAIITISEKQMTEIVGLHKICNHKKAHVIPLGFDLSRFSIDAQQKRVQFRKLYGLADNELAIGIIGRFAPVKNHQLFFDSLFLLEKKTKNFRAFVIGDGDAKDHWMSYVKKFGINDVSEKVIFTSWIYNIENALAGLDVVVLSSDNEGTPVSLIEAQASSRVVIATDVGGVRDCVLDGVSGIVVPAKNSIALSDAIFAVAGDAILRKNMGDAGHSFVNSKYSYARLVQDIKALYRHLLIAR